MDNIPSTMKKKEKKRSDPPTDKTTLSNANEDHMNINQNNYQPYTEFNPDVKRPYDSKMTSK